MAKKGSLQFIGSEAHYFTPGPITSSTKSDKITKTKNRVGRTNPLIVDQQLSPGILGEVHLKIAFWSSDVFPLCPPTKEVHYLKSHFFSPFSAIITFSWQPLEDKNIGRTHFFKEHIMHSNFHFQLDFHFSSFNLYLIVSHVSALGSE